MSVSFSSTIHTLVSGLRVAGEQLAAFECRDGASETLYAGVKTARVTISGENDLDLAETNNGPFTYVPDISALYNTLKAEGMYEVIPYKLLLNPSTFSVITVDGSKVVINIEGGENPFVFEKDATATELVASPGNKWKLPTVTFGQISAAALTFRESVDLELEDLGDNLAQELLDRAAADAVIQADVDANESAAALARAALQTALEASIAGVQADVDQNESDADAAIAAETAARAAAVAAVQADVDQNESDADAAIAAVQADVDQNEADADAAITAEAAARAAADTTLQSNLDIETAARLAGDATTLVGANTYTDNAITALKGTAPGILDTLGEIADAINDDANVYTTLVNQIATVQADVDGNEADADTAIAAEAAARAAAIAAVQADVDQNEADADAAIAAEAAARAAAVTAVQNDVDQNEADADSAINAEASTRAAADTALSGRLDTLEADPTTQTLLDAETAARVAGDAAANTYTDNQISALIGAAPAVLNTLEEIANSINDDDDVYTTLVSQIVAGDTTEAAARAAADTAEEARVDALIASGMWLFATQADFPAAASNHGRVVHSHADGSMYYAHGGAWHKIESETEAQAARDLIQADVDQNETDADAADAALSGRLDTLEADPTTATAVAAVQADVDQNEADSDAAEAALSARLDVLEADPTTATAVAAVQADVDQNEADADAALALKAPLADPDFTGVLEVDTNARLEFDSNLTKLHNVLRGTSIVVGNNITLNPAAADGRVEVEGEFYLRPSDLTNAADDTAAAAAGVIVGQVYHNNGALRVRLS